MPAAPKTGTKQKQAQQVRSEKEKVESMSAKHELFERRVGTISVFCIGSSVIVSIVLSSLKKDMSGSPSVFCKKNTGTINEKQDLSNFFHER